MCKNVAPVCSFCNKSNLEVKNLIAGPPEAFICDECVAVCDGILLKIRMSTEAKALKKMLDLLQEALAEHFEDVPLNDHVY